MKLKALLTCCLLLLGTTSFVSAQDDEKSPADVAAAARNAKDSEATPSAPQMTLILRDGQKMEGVPVQFDDVNVSTSFGNVKLPLSIIAGIRFPQSDKEMTTFALANGDILTGSLDADAIEIVSQWGKANVNVSSIASLTTVPGLVWTSGQGISGERHSLVRPTSSNPQQRPTGSASSSTVPRQGSAQQRSLPNRIQVNRQF